MKKALSLLLAALFVVAVIGTAAAEPSGSGEVAVKFDENSPYRVVNGVIYVGDKVFAGDIIGALVDKTGATVRTADGAALAATDAAGGGETLEVGGASAKILRLGDANVDGKINSRDVVGMMLSLVNSADAEKTTDVDGDGKLNAIDVTKLMKKLVGWDVVFDFPAQAATDEDGALGIYFASSMLRIAREDVAKHGTTEGVIYTAKNEIEDAHILVTSAESRSKLTFDVGEIKNAAGDVLDREVRYGYYYDNVIWRNLDYIPNDYSNYISGYWADPYPELRSTFDINANESQSFIVKVKTTAATAAGWYSAPVRVLDEGGRELKKTTLRVYVWNFAIDDHDLSRTTLDTYSQGLAGFFGSRFDKKYFNGENWQPWYKKWYDYVLENKMNTAELPYEITDDRVDEYLDDPRVTSFITQTGNQLNCWYEEGTAPALRAKYNKLKQKDEWLDKAYIYTVDEPWNVEGAERVRTQWNFAKEILDDIIGENRFQTIVPYYNNWFQEEKMDMTEYMWDFCNVFCPDAVCFSPAVKKLERIKNKDKYPQWGVYPEDKQIDKYGEYGPRYESLRERGDKMWWYICVTPVYPAPNFFITYQGAWSRIVLWQQYNVHADGFLYWSMIMWNMGEHDNRYITLKRVNGGDGLLLYPGTFWYGSDEPLPVPSIRFEVVRDGFEDYAYMRQIERFIGRDEALKYCDRCTTGTLYFSQDWHDIDDTRNEMGWKLEELNAD